VSGSGAVAIVVVAVAVAVATLETEHSTVVRFAWFETIVDAREADNQEEPR
jgi:hypothetical protein